MTKTEQEIAESWKVLESFGFPPEAIGWPFHPIEGRLPEAIECALRCLTEQKQTAV